MDPSPALGPVAVVGTTTWGTTLAIVLARRALDVRLLARTRQEADALDSAREHRDRLPGYRFPSTLSVTSDWNAALRKSVAVLFVVPSQSLRENARLAAPSIAEGAIVISACKGLEQATHKRMSQVLAEELPANASRVCVLSGPNLAREIVAEKPASTVIASENDECARLAQSLLNSATFRVYTNADMVGTELGGALKNIIAIGAGISDGMGLGDNAKAGFITRGLAEITRLGVAAGANPMTFAGNAGLGDLLATCASPLSRNHQVGVALAQGKTLEQAIADLGGEVAEGVATTPAALALARQHGVEMPITELTHRVLFEGLPPRDALTQLMARVPRPE